MPPSSPLRPVTLSGDHIRLVPLSASHLDALCAIGLDAALWEWTPGEPLLTRQAMRDYMDEALEGQAAGHMLPFVIEHQASGEAVGCTRYGNIVPMHRRLEIGWTWVAKAWQRTAVNTEAKLLLLSHAFDTLKYNRVELKTDSLNTRSRDAISRIGAQFEGTLRHHVVTASGRLRDTVYYSILAEEWPTIRSNLEAKLREPR